MSTKAPEPGTDTPPDLSVTSSGKQDRNSCGLDGCNEPLPPRPLDELGRPKGGRRARYCSKAHADAASRQRRANDLASVADPLALAREATAGVLPVAKQLSEQLTSLISRFEQAENGALARVRAAETEAGEAHAEAARAAEGEQQAEQARREALAEARKDREERDRALKSAAQARAEAEQTRDDAWKQVAEHERSRGQAEAELEVTRNSLETLRREHAELLQTTQEQQSRITQLDLRIATTDVELRQAGERAAELSTRLELTEEQHRQALANAEARHQAQARAANEQHRADLQETADRHKAELQAAAERHRAELREARESGRTESGRGPAQTETTGRPSASRAPRPTLRRPRVAGNRSSKTE